ncbi:hypothetical protein E2C01_001113 [Portunus trituberculatus]|uniref:Uncharacterized protein n=1 Tax=Portunus trituberculatus TaxID=210409 RepID=A0A5B7CGZ2_PORTR|nr:hypothetical protein [Portunus trituberculatus]
MHRTSEDCVCPAAPPRPGRKPSRLTTRAWPGTPTPWSAPDPACPYVTVHPYPRHLPGTVAATEKGPLFSPTED